ncbi:MAG: hypothetical protein WKF66_09715 [Pedobacter sp.]
MKNKLLLPVRFRKTGWIIFIITTIAFIVARKYEWEPSMLNYTYTDNNGRGSSGTNLLKEIFFTCWMIGLMMIAFSKEKNEDEYIAYLRLSSWQYSVFASLMISILGTWFIYGMNYLMFSALNMLTAPLAFIVIFNLTIYRTLKRNTIDDK